MEGKLQNDTPDLCEQSLFVTTGMPEEVLPASLGFSAQTINTSSFHGCIRNLYINHELQDFTRGHMKPGVVPGCQACRKLYCVHGVCRPDGAKVTEQVVFGPLLCLSSLRVLEVFSYGSWNDVLFTGPPVSLSSRLGGTTL